MNEKRSASALKGGRGNCVRKIGSILRAGELRVGDEFLTRSGSLTTKVVKIEKNTDNTITFWYSYAGISGQVQESCTTPPDTLCNAWKLVRPAGDEESVDDIYESLHKMFL